jgi:hypothetical protein
MMKPRGSYSMTPPMPHAAQRFHARHSGCRQVHRCRDCSSRPLQRRMSCATDRWRSRRRRDSALAGTNNTASGCSHDRQQPACRHLAKPLCRWGNSRSEAFFMRAAVPVREHRDSTESTSIVENFRLAVAGAGFHPEQFLPAGGVA